MYIFVLYSRAQFLGFLITDPISSHLFSCNFSIVEMEKIAQSNHKLITIAPLTSQLLTKTITNFKHGILPNSPLMLWYDCRMPNSVSDTFKASIPGNICQFVITGLSTH